MARKLSLKLQGYPTHMFSTWGERFSATPNNPVPDTTGEQPVWNVYDAQPTTEATGQRSTTHADEGIPTTQVAVSSDLGEHEDDEAQEDSFANYVPPSPEQQTEETPISNIIPAPNAVGPASTPADYDSHSIPPYQTPTTASSLPPAVPPGPLSTAPHNLPSTVPSGLLPAISPSRFSTAPPNVLPTGATNSPHAPHDASRYHPYHRPWPQSSLRPTAQLEKTHVSMDRRASGRRHPSNARREFVHQVRPTSMSLPQPSIDAATSAYYWPGTLDPAALRRLVAEPEAESVYGLPPQAYVPSQAVGFFPQETPAYPPVLPQGVTFSGYNAVAGPAFQPREDSLMIGHPFLHHHQATARPQWAAPQAQYPSGPVAGPSRNEASLEDLGDFEVQGPSSSGYPAHYGRFGGNPPRRPQWQ